MYSLLLMGRLVIPPLVQLLRNLRYFKRKMASKMEKWGKVGMCIHSFSFDSRLFNLYLLCIPNPVYLTSLVNSAKSAE